MVGLQPSPSRIMMLDVLTTVRANWLVRYDDDSALNGHSKVREASEDALTNIRRKYPAACNRVESARLSSGHRLAVSGENINAAVRVCL
jgi:hypothetical protein